MFFSQFGEDKILFEICHRKTSGFCVEVGANNGIDDSTSLFFENIGWKCILVEPNPSLCKEIREKRKALLYECAASNRTDTKLKVRRDPTGYRRLALTKKFMTESKATGLYPAQ